MAEEPIEQAECRAYVDPQCEELAIYFLGEGHTNEDVLDMALAIQQAVEDWWGNHHWVTDWQDPNLPAPSNPLMEGKCQKNE